MSNTIIQLLDSLRQLLVMRLSEDDLRILCSHLGLYYDRLPAQGQAARTDELLRTMAQADRIYELVAAGKSLRPELSWDAAVAVWSQAHLDADMAWWRAKRDWDDADRREYRRRRRVVNVRPLDMTHTFKDRTREVSTLREYLADSKVRLISVVGRGGMGKTALVSYILAELEKKLVSTAHIEDERLEGLPPELYSRLRATLQTCGHFDSEHTMRTLFVDARLTPWRDKVPGGDSIFVRIQKLISFLFEQSADVDGTPQNALVLLLYALRDQTEPGDACHRRLIELADELESLLDVNRKVSRPAMETGKRQSIDGILYLSARSTGLNLARIYTDVGRMLGDPAASRLAARWTDRDISLMAKVEYLLETLESGTYIVLLDNFEDMLDTDNVIREEGLRLFIERCMLFPGAIRLVVTSREQVTVDPAGLSRVRHLPLLEGLPENEAVALLHDLDQDGRLGLRTASEVDLYQAARFTQGIPRALEILAGILDRDPTLTLAELLTDEAVFSAHVMESLIAAGYKRLEENERRVIEALAVFNRPVDATAVAFVLYPWFPALDVRASLRRLLSSYLVTLNRATAEYSLHPLDQEYVYQKIPRDKMCGGENNTTESASAVYNQRNIELRTAEYYVRLRKPENTWESIEDLQPQLEEYEHRFRARDYDGAAEVLEMIDYKYLYSRWSQYSWVFSLREPLLGKLTQPYWRMRNLNGLNRACLYLRQFKSAIEYGEQALCIARELGIPQEECYQLTRLGLVYRSMKHLEKATTYFEQARKIAVRINDREELGRQFGHLGSVYYQLGDIRRALDSYEKALAFDQEIENFYMEANHLWWLGRCYYALDDNSQAMKLFERSLEINHNFYSLLQEIKTLNSLGNLYCAIGQFTQACSFHDRALGIAEEIGYQKITAPWCLLGLSRAFLSAGLLSEAEQYCMEILAIDVPEEVNYQATLILGIIYLHRDHVSAGEVFADMVKYCQTLLIETGNLYEVRYKLAASMVGQAVCDPCWTDLNQRADLLLPAISEYRRALAITTAPGVVRDALRDLEFICAAGIEGLEPIFALLEGVLVDG